MALQISRYNPMHRALKYRGKRQKSHSSDASDDPSDSDHDATDHSYDPGSKVNIYKQNQKRLSDDEIRQIADRYRAGASSTYELADEFGVHRSTISRALKKCGIEVTHKASEREVLVERILQMYETFMRPADIGKELGISESTVRKILHENGVRIRHSLEYVKK